MQNPFNKSNLIIDNSTNLKKLIVIQRNLTEQSISEQKLDLFNGSNIYNHLNTKKPENINTIIDHSIVSAAKGLDSVNCYYYGIFSFSGSCYCSNGYYCYWDGYCYSCPSGR